MLQRGKWTAPPLACLGLCAAALAAPPPEAPDLEDQYILKIETAGSEGEVRDYGEKLRAIASERTIPRLLGLLHRQRERILGSEDEIAVAFFRCIIKTGPSGVAAVILDLDGPGRRKALGQFKFAGEESVPVLAACLKHPRPEIRAAAVASIPLNEHSPELSAIKDLLADPEMSVRYQAAFALVLWQPGQLGVRKLLRAALGEPDVEIRREAALILGPPGAPADISAPELIACLDDPDPKVRGWAAKDLTDSHCEEALLPLLRGMGDPSIAPKVISYIWNLVHNIPKDSPVLPQAIPVLLKVLDSQDTELTEWAWEILAEIGPPAAAAIPLALEVLRGSGGQRSDAMAFLWHMGPLAEPAIPALVEELAHNAHGLRAQAAATLGSIGPAAREAKAALSAIIRDPICEEDAKVGYIRALCKIAPNDAEALGYLLGIVNDDGVSDRSRTAAVESLAAFIERSDEAFRAIMKTIENEKLDIITRTRAADGLRKSPRRMEEVLPALIRLLEGKEESLQTTAAITLGRMGVAARTALPALKRAHDQRKGSGFAALAIIDIDPGSLTEEEIKKVFQDPWNARFLARGRMGARGLPALIDSLKKKDYELEELIDSLRAIGSSSVPPLVEALASDDLVFRSKIIRALGALGPAARDALPALRKALGDEDDEVRREAAKAISQIEKQPPAKQ